MPYFHLRNNLLLILGGLPLGTLLQFSSYEGFGGIGKVIDHRDEQCKIEILQIFGVVSYKPTDDFWLFNKEITGILKND